ncbi:GTPase Era [Arthrobacter ulcerisalmonis]|uniref:GTPase Era n=1 Tax=Arthrobacter ulcerisalmonis TaxID=2483813 RepID=A0A3P5XLE7_9MICC|nr:GTPase [Arthrobacter ulcerisalmonis]VDC29596.1 GTPase Era [Arthrobacter ulcerisalmonis]
MSRHSAQRDASRLQDRLEALNEARELAGGVLPEEVLDAVEDVLERATARRSLSAEHTVVGFFGATGSGKSSLFNAVLGQDTATVAARRPTTSQPLASLWKGEGSGELLDWLEVDQRHPSGPVHGLADAGSGLILLDLPDVDSTSTANREIVQRLAGMVDVLVWVLDPQKYADNAVHSGFLAPMSAHGAVTLVVLNQMDRLATADAPAVLESLRAILAAEGLGRVPVLPASAVSGAGVAELRSAISGVVVRREALSQRLAADVQASAQALAAASGSGSPAGVQAGAAQRLARELSTAANVPVVVAAVERSYRLEAARRTGWPVTRWLGRFRVDPLRRLNLRRDPAQAHVNRTSLPPAAAPQRARTDSAVRAFADDASAGAPGPWRAAIRDAARAGREQLPNAVDQAIAGTDLQANKGSWWWSAVNVVQWLALVVGLAGAGWLGVLAGLGYLQLPVPAVPRVEGWPLPTLMILGGVLLGVLLAIAGGVVSAAAARLRGRNARRRLDHAVDAVAGRLVVEPVRDEVLRCEAFAKAVRKATGAGPHP